MLASYWTQRCLEGGKGWNALLAVLGLTYSSFPPHHSVAVTHWSGVQSCRYPLKGVFQVEARRPCRAAERCVKGEPKPAGLRLTA